MYGATETGPVSIYLRAEDAHRKVGSAGKAAMHAEIRLVDAEGRDVAPGEVGEILVRAPNLMYGYWKDPDNPAFRDGWFHTGDLARVDGEGYYWVVGRSKDMIISGGENVYPAELENILADCPRCGRGGGRRRARSEVGRGGRRGDRPKKPGAALDEAAVIALFEGRLARFKHAAARRVRRHLPKSALGQGAEVRVAEAGG